VSYTDSWKEAEKAKTVFNVSPEWFTFEKKGSFVLGKLMGSSEVDSSLGSGTYLQYLFDTDSGLVKCSLGAATDKELHTVLKVGNVYRIEFLGQAKIKGGRRVNQFKCLAAQAPDDLQIVDSDVPF